MEAYSLGRGVCREYNFGEIVDKSIPGISMIAIAGHSLGLKIQLKTRGINRRCIKHVPNLQRNHLPVPFVGSRHYISAEGNVNQAGCHTPLNTARLYASLMFCLRIRRSTHQRVPAVKILFSRSSIPHSHCYRTRLFSVVPVD